MLRHHHCKDHALQRRHLDGDSAAREELIERYVPLAKQLARRFRDRAEPLADLTQVAYVGLLAAVDRWDPDRGTAFSSFAVPTILGELRRYFRDSTWMVRPPRDLQELWMDICRARDQLWQQLGREPAVTDVAADLGVTMEQVNEALQAGATRAAGSLDEPLRADETGSATVLDRAASSDDHFASADAAITLDQVSRVLDRRSREVIRLRYREDLLQREIAERVGCSQMQVSRILKDAILTLQHHYGSMPDRVPAR
jgi:RNA polymerase sigma-B factor